jgi:hypothetical protein
MIWERVREENEDDDTEIVETFILTFHNGDFDAEFNDALSFDRDTPLFDRPTQTSYIKPDNWRERNQIGLEKVKERLQNLVDSLCPVHDQSLQLKLLYHGYGHQLVDDEHQLVDNEHPIVWHEPILDDYWDRIEKGARRLLDSVTEICIGIENVEIRKSAFLH